MRTRRRRRCRRIDHADLHGACSTCIFTAPPPPPSRPDGSCLPRVTLRRSRRSDHSSSKSPALDQLGTAPDEPIRDSIHSLSPRLLRAAPPEAALFRRGYVRRGKAKSNYIRDTGIPHRARSAGQLKNNRSSSRTGPPLRDVLSFLSLSLSFFSRPFLSAEFPVGTYGIREERYKSARAVKGTRKKQGRNEIPTGGG